MKRILLSSALILMVCVFLNSGVVYAMFSPELPVTSASLTLAFIGIGAGGLGVGSTLGYHWGKKKRKRIKVFYF